MSLDFSLTEAPGPVRCECCGVISIRAQEVFTHNITHNLNSMADAAGLYKVLWRPDENQITTARQAIPLLTEGLERLRSDPNTFKRLNPENNRGNYQDLVNFTASVLAACKAYPDASISVSR